MEGLISVIVPVYKTEKYLPKCIESITSQTYKNLEIILVDDGSPDGSGAICDRYAEEDGRIKVIHQENKKVSEARNAGMRIASGEYIAFVDSDDYIEPDMYEVLHDLIEKYGADLAMCGLYYECEGGERVPSHTDGAEYLWDRDTFARELLLMHPGMGYVWNKLYRREKLGDNLFRNEKGCAADVCSEDICFNYRFMNENKSFAYRRIPKYSYVSREGSITKQEFNETAFSIVYATKSFMEDQKNNKNTYQYGVRGYTDAAFTVMSGIITSGKLTERFDELRSGILSHKKDIFFGGQHGKKEKIKCLLLWISPSLYKKVIHKVRKK